MKSKSKNKRIIFISSIFAVSLLSLIFIISNFRDNIVFFYSPSELKIEENLKKVRNRSFRVGGLVKKGSIQKVNALKTVFVVTDLESDLKITYSGILPELFRTDQGVVAKGRFDVEKNEFFSKELLIKHDEKYMPPEVTKSLKGKIPNS